ncbi:protoporphyrinogen oxidase [Corynebacterium sp. ES2730-CONJ]|uniref:protoporphyrinogen oxidase n=1 Tax=Corynebacterium sp. ES2730-CONJ TaxID=2973941 RepID=UPI00216B0F71|nr:protoporphyrinogen oxidase [Corynebacterium sp. ES2730-CONJ]MCS4531625.1 protoporphyrinogen oxidase [Corynebacterium sp. ES2730-CONJ]
MRVAIIGAGLAGLTTAWQIHQEAPDTEVDIFEASDRIGGKLYTVPFHSGPTDMGAEAYLNFRADATDFFKQLGLADSLVYPSGLPSSFYAAGQLHDMVDDTIMGIPAASTSIKDLIDAETAARIDAEDQGPGIEWEVDGPDISLGDLISQRYGELVNSRLVSALQGGVYSARSEDLGIRATLPQLARTFDEMALAGEKISLKAAIEKILSQRQRNNRNNHERGYRPHVFATFKGGYAQVYETLAEASQARIYVDAFISGITDSARGYALRGGGEGYYDAVVVATPAPTTSLLLKTIAPDISPHFSTIPLASSVVVGMKFASDRGLPDNSGILVATDEVDIKAKAFTFSSKKWPHLGSRGGALVRASFGRYKDDEICRADEDVLVDHALADLKKITGFDGIAAGLDEIFVQRWFGGLPVYGPGHLETVAAITEGLAHYPGLYATGAWAQGVGVPAVIAHARGVAHTICGNAEPNPALAES